jgi:hypothetical protein
MRVPPPPTSYFSTQHAYSIQKSLSRPANVTQTPQNAFPIAVGESFPTYATKTACGSNASPIDASASPPRNAATQSPSVNAELTILLRPCNAIRINPLRSHHWILCF